MISQIKKNIHDFQIKTIFALNFGFDTTVAQSQLQNPDPTGK